MMEVTRATFDDDSSGYKVEHDGETYKFETVGGSAVRLADADTLPSEVAEEIQSLGFGTIEVNEDFHIRTDDPDDAHVGMRWYRSDRGTVRQQVPGGVIDERAVYDAPREKVIEDFEGKTVDEINTLAQAGDPSFAIVERDGADWFSVEGDSSNIGGILEGTGEVVYGAGAEMEANGGISYTLGLSPDSNPPTEGYVYLYADADVGTLDLREYTSSGDDSINGTGEPTGEELQNPHTVRFSIDEDTVVAEVETTEGTYDISGTLSEPDTVGGDYIVAGISLSSTTGGTLYLNDIRTVESIYPSQISPALAHSDLADAPASAHHTRPTAGAGIQDNGDTFRAKYDAVNLNERTGNYGGELAADDGTNTPARGTLCLWDASNSVWRPQNNPDGGAF